jgi:hypothetical protein
MSITREEKAKALDLAEAYADSSGNASASEGRYVAGSGKKYTALDDYLESLVEPEPTEEPSK